MPNKTKPEQSVTEIVSAALEERQRRLEQVAEAEAKVTAAVAARDQLLVDARQPVEEAAAALRARASRLFTEVDQVDRAVDEAIAAGDAHTAQQRWHTMLQRRETNKTEVDQVLARALRSLPGHGHDLIQFRWPANVTPDSSIPGRASRGESWDERLRRVTEAGQRQRHDERLRAAHAARKAQVS